MSIHRPGRIGGHSRTGAWKTNDLTCRMIKGCIQLGCAPSLDATLDLTPVDYVSRAIVHLTRREAPSGATYHLRNSTGVLAEELFDHVRAFGYALRPVPPGEWLARLSGAAASGAENAIGPMAALLAERFGTPEAEQRLDERGPACDQTVAALAGSSIACPAVTRSLLESGSAVVHRG